MKLKFTAALATLACCAANAEVWLSQSTWTPEMETAYSQWISKSFTQNIFVNSENWANIATDCADAVYTSRIIFSFENKLPFSIKDPTGSGNYITNQMSRWDNINDSNLKVRKFIAYINDITDTKTLPNDTYPIRINHTAMTPGTVWIRSSQFRGEGFWDLFLPSEEPGHTETVTGLDENGTIHLLGSTVPPKVRKLIPTTTLVLAPNSTDLGFRHWVLPQNKALPASRQPGYSLEQYRLNTTTGAAFETEVMNHVGTRPETTQELIDRMSLELCNLATARIETVNDALAYSKRIGRCMSPSEYDSYSTPSRDQRILLTTQRLIQAAGNNSVSNTDAIIEGVVALEKCSPLHLTSTLDLEMKTYVKNVFNKKISSNPNELLAPRWGIEPAAGTCGR